MSKQGRSPRVAAALRDELARLVPDEVRDPRVAAAGVVSVNHVELNRDGSIARVYVSFVGGDAVDDAVRDAAIEALDRAGGYLRGPLGKRMRLGRVPQLRFAYDPTAEVGMQLTELVRADAARTSDDPDDRE